MAQTIVIIGGLKDDPDRNLLLRKLREKAGQDIEWEWYQALSCNHYDLQKSEIFKLVGKVKTNVTPGQTPRVVKLYRLHQRTQNSFYKVCPDPVPAPRHVDSVPDLVNWLLSAEANLVPQREWWANAAETALVAILAKLIKNKSWNKDTQGHEWTKEADILGQAPVSRSHCPEVRTEAAKLLPSVKGKLLLCKGGKQGKTPREWSIRLSVLTNVKQSMIDQSLGDLAKLSELKPIIERASKDEDRCHRLDGEVVTERVRHICRDRGT
ncbi:MAG: hypothetical protein KAV82_04545 [Phycisphaerae bacterium]|nr:hypothetical protein [Phycisphaerae bacterium]